MKTLKYVLAVLRDWDQKKNAPKTHADQPVVEFYIEQVMVTLLTVIALRSHDRGDLRTYWRMRAVAEAGAAVTRRDEVN